MRIKSMLPKTAANFHKMKKGLFLNPIKGYPYNLKEEALARSFNILQAYGEIVPQLIKAAKRPKVKARNKSVKVSRGELFQGNSSLVIRDSPEVIRKREQLSKQKWEIMNGEKDNTPSGTSAIDENSQMNKFIQDKLS